MKLYTHLSGSVITVAHCCKITLINGKIVGLTDCDTDLKIDRITYNSSPGVNLKFIHSGKNSGTAEIETTAANEILSRESLLCGFYNSAEVIIMLVNYKNPSIEYITIFEGNVDKVVRNNNLLKIFLRKRTAYELSKRVCSIFSPRCRAQFCDPACGLSSTVFSFKGSIEKVPNRYKTFWDNKLRKPDNFFKHGIVTFSTGRNRGMPLEVHSHEHNSVTLIARTPFPLVKGDSYAITAGCDKNFSTCKEKFNNTANFRGEPHIPELNSIYSPSDT